MQVYRHFIYIILPSVVFMFLSFFVYGEEHLEQRPRVKNRILILKSFKDLSTQSDLFVTAVESKYGPVRIEPIGKLGSIIDFAEGVERTEEQVAEELMDQQIVEWAGPDYITEPVLTPTDPFYLKYKKQHEQINAPAAWGVVDYRELVKILVCDTGIDTSHPDLKNRLSLKGQNFAVPGAGYEDQHGHGTHVAGTIGAEEGNSLGGVGVTWQAQITAGKIAMNKRGQSTLSIMSKCIYYGAEHGYKVVNLSFSGYGSPVLEAASRELKQSGGLLFMAAGNNDQDLSGLLDSPDTFVVGATGSGQIKANFSNYGTPIDLVAPGVGIFATYLDGKYELLSGTSMATPIVAGAAALLFAHVPTANPNEIESALIKSAKDLGAVGDDHVFGAGLLQADQALKVIENNSDSTAPKAVIESDKTEGFAPLSVNVSGASSYDMDGEIVSYEWTVDGSLVATGPQAQLEFKDPGRYRVSLVVIDDRGKTGRDFIIENVLKQPDLEPIYLPGLRYGYYEGEYPLVPLFSEGFYEGDKVSSGTVGYFNIENRERDNFFAFGFEGYIKINRSGIYRFYLYSDDSSLLFINDSIVVNNNGAHRRRTRSGSVFLRQGYHKIESSFAELGGREYFKVDFESAYFDRVEVPAEVLFHTE